MTKRYPCVRCRARIDVDLHTCPACGETYPLRYLRSRRIGQTVMFVVIAAVVVAVAASTWLALV